MLNPKRQAFIGILLFVVLVGAGCGKKQQNTPSEADKAAASNAINPIEAGCDKYGSSDTEQYRAGKNILLPADFPRAPQEAQLCGSSEEFEFVYYFLPNGNVSDILNYYRAQLEKQGFHVRELGSASISFDNGKTKESGQYISGTVGYERDRAELGIGYKSQIWRKEHNKDLTK